MPTKPDGGGRRPVESHDRFLPPPLRTRFAQGDLGHVVIECGDVHGAEHGERPILDRPVERNVQRVPVLIRLHDLDCRRSTALECERESLCGRIEDQFLDANDRAPLFLDRSDEERGAECRMPKIRRRLGAEAPIAILRIDNQDLLTTHRPDHP